MHQHAGSSPVVLSRRRVFRGLFGLIGTGAAVALAGCGIPGKKPDLVPSQDDAKAALTIRAFDNAYEPKSATINVGQAVRWVFEGPAEHDVVAGDGSFVSELMVKGSYTHRFETEGDFPYDCSIHPEMVGMIRVIPN